MNDIAPQILAFYRQQKGVYSWTGIGEILNTNKGTAWEIAHGKRKPTEDQIMRWLFWQTFATMDGYHTVPAIPCPTCGQLHQVEDCHGQAGEPVMLPEGAHIVQPRPPSSKPARRRWRLDLTEYDGQITADEVRELVRVWITASKLWDNIMRAPYGARDGGGD